MALQTPSSAPAVSSSVSPSAPTSPTSPPASPSMFAATPYDLAIIGAGPAGLALASACAVVGLSVCLISDVIAPWANAFGCWRQSWPDDLADAILETYTNPQVLIDEQTTLDLQTPYIRVDNERVFMTLLDRFVRNHGVLLQKKCKIYDANTVILHDLHTPHVAENVIKAHLVVDAMGTQAQKNIPTTGAPAYQLAYGIRAFGFDPQMPVAIGSDPHKKPMLSLMDYRPIDDDPEIEKNHPPTFLYAMTLPDGSLFWEETSLVCRSGVTLDLLAERLHQRLEKRGVRIDRVVETEKCQILMNASIPNYDDENPIFYYGAKASMVHPATGYMMADAVRLAPDIAHALKLAKAQYGHLDDKTKQYAQVAWQALYSDDAKRSRAFYLWGMESLLGFGPAQIRSHFATFFTAPASEWTAYLQNNLSPAQIRMFMLRLFGRSPLNMKYQLAKSAMTDAKSAMFASLFA